MTPTDLDAVEARHYAIRSHVGDVCGFCSVIMPCEAMQLAAELRAARERIEALASYASHLEWCAWCGDDGVEGCHDGSELRAAARAAQEG